MRNGIACLLIGALLTSACASTRPPSSNRTSPKKPNTVKEWMQSRSRKGAVAGFLIGAAAGLVSAKLTGASDEEAVERAFAGGVIGAMAGFAVGKHNDAVYANRDYAVRQSNYTKSQGYVARVEEVTFNPQQPKPGTTATLYVRYVVIGPNPNEPINVKMFRGLKYGDDYIFGAGPNKFTVPKGGGVIESTMTVTLPKKAPQGTYSVEAVLEDPKHRFPDALGTGPLYVVARAKQHGEIEIGRAHV